MVLVPCRLVQLGVCPASASSSCPALCGQPRLPRGKPEEGLAHPRAHAALLVLTAAAAKRFRAAALQPNRRKRRRTGLSGQLLVLKAQGEELDTVLVTPPAKEAEPVVPANVKREEKESSKLVPIASSVGVFTGAGIVALNLAVHEIQDLLRRFGDTYDIPSQVGPLIWGPLLGGLVVSLSAAISDGKVQQQGTSLRDIREACIKGERGGSKSNTPLTPGERARRAGIRTVLAAATLGSGNSLGPEGPSVEIGANVAAFLGRFGEASTPFAKSETKFGLLAAGCAAGVAAGFNAPIAGLFFAVEVVKPPQSEETEVITSRLLAAAFAAAVVQIGLGASPAVKGIVFSDRRFSPAAYLELPLYMALGALCGVASGAFDSAKGLAIPFFNRLASAGIPRVIHPLIGSFFVALVAGTFDLPELLYSGFDNVNRILREASDYDTKVLLELLVGKILLTAICTGSGLVGGIFAPAIFIGAAGGALFGQGVEVAAANLHLPFESLSLATDFAAVGSAAVLAAVCGVPLTSVVLLLELSGGKDYAICLPLIAAVGLSVYVDRAILKGTDGSRTAGKGQDALSRISEASKLFDTVDKDKDGTITREEFQEWFGELGERVQQQVLRLAGQTGQTKTRESKAPKKFEQSPEPE